MIDPSEQWYFNTVTQKPELGPISPVAQRMGPYKSREDAERAWEIFNERNQRWEAEDSRWNNA